MSVQEMRAELKLLRSEHPDHRPVSKMKKADISSLLEKMKQHTEITPAIAKTKGEAEKPAKGEVEKLVKVDVKPEKAAKKGKAEPKKDEAKEEKVEKKKETIAERMARIRAMRKKE